MPETCKASGAHPFKQAPIQCGMNSIHHDINMRPNMVGPPPGIEYGNPLKNNCSFMAAGVGQPPLYPQQMIYSQTQQQSNMMPPSAPMPSVQNYPFQPVLSDVLGAPVVPNGGKPVTVVEAQGFQLQHPLQQQLQYPGEQQLFPKFSTNCMIPPMSQQFQQAPGQLQNFFPDAVNGGVTQDLDYDISTMAQFVVKNTCVAFATSHNQIVHHSGDRNAIEIFTNGISSVLNATRLPSVTIFLALDYLFKHNNKIAFDTQLNENKSINLIYQSIIISFVLANKFNDDKTFTNRSWAQATGIAIDTINESEKRWLQDFEWDLYRDKFALYHDFVHYYESFKDQVINSNLSSPQLSSDPTAFYSPEAVKVLAPMLFTETTSSSLSPTFPNRCDFVTFNKMQLSSEPDVSSDHFRSMFNNRANPSPLSEFDVCSAKNPYYFDYSSIGMENNSHIGLNSSNSLGNCSRSSIWNSSEEVLNTFIKPTKLGSLLVHPTLF